MKITSCRCFAMPVDNLQFRSGHFRANNRALKGDCMRSKTDCLSTQIKKATRGSATLACAFLCLLEARSRFSWNKPVLVSCSSQAHVGEEKDLLMPIPLKALQGRVPAIASFCRDNLVLVDSQAGIWTAKLSSQSKKVVVFLNQPIFLPPLQGMSS